MKACVYAISVICLNNPLLNRENHIHFLSILCANTTFVLVTSSTFTATSASADWSPQY